MQLRFIFHLSPRSLSRLRALEKKCSAHFTFRELIECGETAKARPGLNMPTQQKTLQALSGIAKNILDPLTEHFAKPRLTYGLSCAANSLKISSRIAPKRDQHASHELNASGRPICELGGAAVDFYIPGVDAATIAIFVARSLPFDAMYYYGKDKPLHVSWSTMPRALILEMRFRRDYQRYFPAKRSIERFIDVHGQ